LSHFTSPFSDGFFEVRSHELTTWDWLRIVILLLTASWVARITGVSHWCLEKNLFCLFKIPKQEVSLRHFHVYMYYNPNYFIPFIFILSTLVLFLWWFHQV
jgi:hypothetical protein